MEWCRAWERDNRPGTSATSCDNGPNWLLAAAGNQIEKERDQVARELSAPCERSGGLYTTRFANPTISVYLFHFRAAQLAVAVEVATIFKKMSGWTGFL